MKPNVLGAGKITTTAHVLLSLRIINQQIYYLVRRQRCHHLQENVFYERHAVGPREWVLGPREPGRLVPAPLGRHVITEFSGSRLFHHLLDEDSRKREDRGAYASMRRS